MAQLPISKEYNNFVGGLITEASPLTFPPNASFHEDNMELSRKGYRQRRLGLGFEDGHSLVNLTLSEYSSLPNRAISTYIWKNVSGDADLSILVVQYGRGLRFFDYSESANSSHPLYSGDVLEIEGDVVSIAPLGLDANSQFSFTQINGDLLVAGGDDCVYRVKYNADSDDMEVEAHGLLVRDIWGVDDGLTPRQRTQFPASDPLFLELNTDEHTYNLMNQGWYKPLGNGNVSDTLLDQYFEAYPGYASLLFQIYPSNGDSPHTHYDVIDQTYAAAVAEAHLIPNQLAPRGSIVVDLFYRGLSRQWSTSGYEIINNFGLSDWGDGVSGAMSKLISSGGSIATDILSGELPYDWTRSGVSNIATYAGRVFYSGFFPKYADSVFEGDNLSPRIESYILYSQLVDNNSKVGKCYQEGDPTSDEDFDLVDTDGGFIVIPEMANPHKMITLANSLLIFADNGVWEITGGQAGFSATNHEVRKITDTGAIGKSSIVRAESSVYFWSEGGIYQLTYDVNSLNFMVQNMTETSIQSFYNDISSAGKTFASGVYDPSRKVLTWLFNSDTTGEYDGVTYRFNYDKVLNYDIPLQAFYPFTFYKNEAGLNDAFVPIISGAFITDRAVNTNSVDTVYINGEEVTIDGETVTITNTVRAPVVSQTKYILFRVSHPDEYVPDAFLRNYFTFGILNNDRFIDFDNSRGYQASCPATMTTGQELLGDTQRDKQAKYLTVHCERTETGFTSSGDATNSSSCLITPIWDFSTSSNSGKIGNPVQAYRLGRQYLHTGVADDFDYGQSVITTKSKLRGRGKSLALRFDTEDEKDMIVYGWAITYLGNSEV